MAERKKKSRQYEVLVSFDGLNKGEVFTDDGGPWARQHVQTGYLREVTPEDPPVLQAQAEVAPEAPEETVQEAKNAGEVSQG